MSSQVHARVHIYDVLKWGSRFSATQCQYLHSLNKHIYKYVKVHAGISRPFFCGCTLQELRNAWRFFRRKKKKRQILLKDTLRLINPYFWNFQNWLLLIRLMEQVAVCLYSKLIMFLKQFRFFIFLNRFDLILKIIFKNKKYIFKKFQS